MELRDLPPRHDPKGGSPKTPGAIPVSEYHEATNGSGVWKWLVGLLAGLLIGALGMWLTALQEKGISRKDMEDYVDKHSPYASDKSGIADHQSRQDNDIGELRAGDRDIQKRLDKIEAKIPN